MAKKRVMDMVKSRTPPQIGDLKSWIWLPTIFSPDPKKYLWWIQYTGYDGAIFRDMLLIFFFCTILRYVSLVQIPVFRQIPGYISFWSCLYLCIVAVPCVVIIAVTLCWFSRHFFYGPLWTGSSSCVGLWFPRMSFSLGCYVCPHCAVAGNRSGVGGKNSFIWQRWSKKTGWRHV